MPAMPAAVRSPPCHAALSYLKRLNSATAARHTAPSSTAASWHPTSCLSASQSASWLVKIWDSMPVVASNCVVQKPGQQERFSQRRRVRLEVLKSRRNRQASATTSTFVLPCVFMTSSLTFSSCKEIRSRQADCSCTNPSDVAMPSSSSTSPAGGRFELLLSMLASAS